MTNRLRRFFTLFKKADFAAMKTTNYAQVAPVVAVVPAQAAHIAARAAGAGGTAGTGGAGHTGRTGSSGLRSLMSWAGLSVRGRYVLRHSPILQIAAIFAFWLLGEAIVRFAGIPVPGGIIGMVIVFALLVSRNISLHSMRQGAQWYLAEMLLFFIPAVLAVLNHHELFGMLGLKVLVVILGSTASVIAVTAVVMDVFMRLRGRHDLV